MKKGVAVVLLFLACSALFMALLAASDDTADPSKPAEGIPDYPKCNGDFQAARMNCLKDIGPDCCKAIKVADDDCADTIFGRFMNPYFVRLVDYCSMA